ncbi:MAG: chemotaxis protein CheX [Thaumarchaeota archaeon]|nr:chemotaxis protein CheX [Nitrososphaerota archaeon]
MEKLSNLNRQEIEKLTRIINQYIASQTSSALSKLLSEHVKYNVMILDKEFFNLNNIKLAPDEIKMCTVKLSGKGDTHIEICYAIKIKYAKMIAAKLLGKEKLEEIDEMGSSAIEEVANILTGSFFNAMSSGTGFRVELSVPDYSQGDLASIVNDSARNVMTMSFSPVIADAELVGEKSGIRIHMLIMQNADNARKLLVNNIEKNKPTEFDSLNDELKSNNKTIGSENSELDSLVDEFLQQENETKQ